MATYDSIKDSRELVLTRHIPAPREKVYQAWTDPALIVQRFTPPPYVTTRAELDARTGGSSLPNEKLAALVNKV